MRSVSAFHCPSDYHGGTMNTQAIFSMADFGVGVTNYKACAGSNWNFSDFRTRKLDRKSPAHPNGYGGRNAAEYDGLDHGDGVICRGMGPAPGGAPIKTAARDIRDGLSHTFLVGEAVPEWCNWSVWYWWNGSTATCGIPLNFKRPGVLREHNRGNDQETYSFMSRHPRGANFGMCDGSVIFIPNDIDIEVYRGRATIDGGEVITEDE